MFEALLNAAHKTHRYIGGRWDEAAVTADDVARYNRKILLTERFKTLFPPDPTD